jgi:hypothetical protein
VLFIVALAEEKFVLFFSNNMKKNTSVVVEAAFTVQGFPWGREVNILHCRQLK